MIFNHPSNITETVSGTICTQYTATILPGTYDVYAYYNGVEEYLYHQTFTGNKDNLDIVLPLYKVTIASDNQEMKAENFGRWYDEANEEYGSGATLYLEEGTYHLDASGSVDFKDYIAVVDIVVAGATANATAHVTVKKPRTIRVDVPADVSSTGDWFQFIPTVTGTYYIYSSNTKGDPEGFLYTEDGSEIAYDDDDGEHRNFFIKYTCESNRA